MAQWWSICFFSMCRVLGSSLNTKKKIIVNYRNSLMSLSFQAMFKFPRLSYKLYITIGLFTLESKCIYHLSLLISRFIVSLFSNLAIICWECQSSEYLSEFWQSVPCEAISSPFCFPSSSLGAGEACWSATGLDVLTRVAKCAVDVFSV